MPRHTSRYEAMANPEPAADLRPVGQFPSDGGSGNWDIAGETDAVSSAPLRWLLLATGLVFVGLAVLGAVLPVLPTVPFLLVAAACFARSSARFYHWLLSNRVFGPLIWSWRDRAGVPSERARVPTPAPWCRRIPRRAASQGRASAGTLRPSSCRPSGAWESSNLGVGDSNPSRRANYLA